MAPHWFWRARHARASLGNKLCAKHYHSLYFFKTLQNPILCRLIVCLCWFVCCCWFRLCADLFCADVGFYVDLFCFAVSDFASIDLVLMLICVWICFVGNIMFGLTTWETTRRSPAAERTATLMGPEVGRIVRQAPPITARHAYCQQMVWAQRSSALATLRIHLLSSRGRPRPHLPTQPPILKRDNQYILRRPCAGCTTHTPFWAENLEMQCREIPS